MKALILSLTALATACSTNALTVGTKSPGWGRHACERFARRAEREASLWTVLGYASGVAGAGLVTAGAVMGESSDMDANWAEQHRNLLVTAAGGVLLFTARSLFKSSDASATAAGLAMRQTSKTDDDDAFTNCVEARSAWIEARKDSNAILGQFVGAQQAKIEAQKHVAEAQKALIEQQKDLIRAQATTSGPQ